jgi:hypothetical protein
MWLPRSSPRPLPDELTAPILAYEPISPERA